MQNFILTSVIASVVFTVLLNLLPRLFPNATRRAEQKVVDAINEREAAEPQDSGPRVKVFFPWKAMLAISVGLTILVNLVGLFAN